MAGRRNSTAGVKGGKGRRGRAGWFAARHIRRRAAIAWVVVVAVAAGFLLTRAAIDHGLGRMVQKVAELLPEMPSLPTLPGKPAPPVNDGRLAPRASPKPIEAQPPGKPVVAESVDEDMAPPWRRYAAAAPAVAERTKPWLAIVIDDVGLDKAQAVAAADLPAPVTLAVMGYADGMAAFERVARERGQELLVHLPMQPLGDADPGQNALLVGLPADELLRRLRWHLDRHAGFVGINNHMGSRFTADPVGMKLVIQELAARGLLFLDSRTIGTSVGERMADDQDVPAAARDVFLDNELGAAAIDAQLALAEEKAKRRGMAIAIGHPHRETLEAIKRFIPKARARGIVMVPLSAIVERRYEARQGPAGAPGRVTGSGKSETRNVSPPPPRG